MSKKYKAILSKCRKLTLNKVEVDDFSASDVAFLANWFYRTETIAATIKAINRKGKV